LSYVELARQKELAHQQMELAQQKVDRLAQKLREMNINPDEL
jgi:hypothetical protein